MGKKTKVSFLNSIQFKIIGLVVVAMVISVLVSMLIVGDSLTSDILGGKQAGIATCWVNPKGAAPRADIVPDHEISALSQLEELLDTI